MFCSSPFDPRQDISSAIRQAYGIKELEVVAFGLFLFCFAEQARWAFRDTS